MFPQVNLNSSYDRDFVEWSISFVKAAFPAAGIE